MEVTSGGVVLFSVRGSAHDATVDANNKADKATRNDIPPPKYPECSKGGLSLFTEKPKIILRR